MDSKLKLFLQLRVFLYNLIQCSKMCIPSYNFVSYFFVWIKLICTFTRHFSCSLPNNQQLMWNLPKCSGNRFMHQCPIDFMLWSVWLWFQTEKRDPVYLVTADYETKTSDELTTGWHQSLTIKAATHMKEDMIGNRNTESQFSISVNNGLKSIGNKNETTHKRHCSFDIYLLPPWSYHIVDLITSSVTSHTDVIIILVNFTKFSWFIIL